MSADLPNESDGASSVVAVVGLWYTLTDYQPEAAMIAMAHWVAATVGVEPPGFDVHFERETNRYIVEPTTD